MSFLTLLSLLPAVLAIAVSKDAAAASCACGFVDSNNNVWRESIVSDFTSAAGALSVLANDWAIAADHEPQGGNATADIQYTTANVLEHNDALGLKASAYTGSGSVNCAEIFTKRKDILYGTFRTRSGVPSTPGVVFGFFTYINDSQESDIEFLSSDVNYYQHVHYTNQPGQTAGATQDVQIPGADFTAPGEHRIDWLPSQTRYYYNGNVAAEHTITIQVPNTPSEFILNVWSNGDPGWSRGPPTADAYATVQTVSLYFNSTSLSASQFQQNCQSAGVPVCRI